MAMELRGFLVDKYRVPISGATVVYKTASSTIPNTNPILGTTSTNASGMWEWLAIADGNYDVEWTYGSLGGTVKKNSQIPHSFSNGQIAAAAGISLSKLEAMAANTVVAGPSSGAAAVPTARALVKADLPALHQHGTALATAGTTTSSATYVNLPGDTSGNCQVVLTTTGGALFALFTGMFRVASAGFRVQLDINLDGAGDIEGDRWTSITANEENQLVQNGYWLPAAGNHTVLMKWQSIDTAVFTCKSGRLRVWEWK